MRILGFEITKTATGKPEECQHRNTRYIGKGGYQCRRCKTIGFKRNGIFTALTLDNLHEAMEHEDD